jgi:shikimate kinase
MITVLIGHRGVGKTSLLERLNRYFPESLCLCLDEEIETRSGSIQDIFASQGESVFREIEKTVFADLYEMAKSTTNAFIALGAGFEGDVPADCRVMWVQRAVDLSRYLFADRPTLNNDKKSPAMPPGLFAARTKRYRAMATDEYLLPEGEFDRLPEEEALFQNNLKFLSGTLTLLPHDVRSAQFSTWIKDRCHWGVESIELRDDLLSSGEIAAAIKAIPVAKRLFSFRRPESREASFGSAAQCALIDWPLEFGEAPAILRNRLIYSLHGEATSFTADLEKLSSMNAHIKWSPVIETLGDLQKAHAWVTADERRSLLPRSANGKWAWYRLLQKHRQPLNFFREGEGSAIDQPSMIQWAQRDVRFQKFAAVLGSPVQHSWTPAFHREFFKNKKMDVFAIDVSETELKDGGFEFLQELGFKAFAVTSPLKNWAASIADSDEPVNTLALNEKENVWYGTSTDKQGFLSLVQQAEILFTRGKNAVVWGGGGILPSLKDVLPMAHFYAAQTGRPRANSSMCENPSTIVWAGGDSIQQITSCHPEWIPERIVDLNYRGDSPGLAYALHTGARYYSGREMFFTQAEEQQKFWRRYEWQ